MVRGAERSRDLPQLVALGSSPEASVGDQRDAEREESLGEFPELPFELRLELLIEGINPQRELPSVGIEPNPAKAARELAGNRRVA